jgi:hypothetical protein
MSIYSMTGSSKLLYTWHLKSQTGTLRWRKRIASHSLVILLPLTALPRFLPAASADVNVLQSNQSRNCLAETRQTKKSQGFSLASPVQQVAQAAAPNPLDDENPDQGPVRGETTRQGESGPKSCASNNKTKSKDYYVNACRKMLIRALRVPSSYNEKKNAYTLYPGGFESNHTLGDRRFARGVFFSYTARNVLYTQLQGFYVCVWTCDEKMYGLPFTSKDFDPRPSAIQTEEALILIRTIWPTY